MLSFKKYYWGFLLVQRSLYRVFLCVPETRPLVFWGDSLWFILNLFDFFTMYKYPTFCVLTVVPYLDFTKYLNYVWGRFDVILSSPKTTKKKKKILVCLTKILHTPLRFCLDFVGILKTVSFCSNLLNTRNLNSY